MSHKSTLALLSVTAFLFLSFTALAQTPVSGFYAGKNEFTFASSYAYKSYDKFYRGTELTEGNPAGLGEISSSIVSLYGEYGILDWLSTTVSIPYIAVESTDGALDPVQNTNSVSGVQDLGVYFKAKAYEKTFKDLSSLALGGATGISIPVGDYEASGVLSLGNRATTIDGIAIAQYTSSIHFFAEAQAGYSIRNNDDFDIPDALLYSFKLGYYNQWFYTHVKLGIQNSLGGFDIGSDEFAAAGGPVALPETEVDYTNLSFDVYVPLYKNTLGISAGYTRSLDGRNFNRESGVSFGLVYKVANHANPTAVSYNEEDNSLE